jgi:hypothetical protein
MMRDFLDHLNSVHQNIQFTMEVQTTTIPSWTHIFAGDPYQNPSNMHAVLSTLVQRARVLCDHKSLHDELEFPRDAFRLNTTATRRLAGSQSSHDGHSTQ